MKNLNEVKMFFSETVRYPTYEAIYAAAGDTRMVKAELVDRMLKRGAKIVDDKKVEVEVEKEEIKLPEQEEVLEETEVEVEVEVENPSNDAEDADPLDGLDLLESSEEVLEETKVEVEAPKSKGKGKKNQ